MKYPIYIYGSGVLRKDNEPIAKDFKDLNTFIDSMFETMYASEGVGLAAPQIGKNLRIFVVDASPMSDEEPELEGFKKVFINPDIYEYSEKEEYFEEGCLSVPGVRENVMRPVSIKMRYLDENFKEKDEEFSGFAARVIQHEYDHIKGELFTDKVSVLRKNLIKSRLDKISKGDFKSSYSCKLVK